MGCFLLLGWNCGSKSIGWDLLVGVVVLEDVSHGLDGVEVLVLLQVKVVEGVSPGWVSIAQGEVDGGDELNLAATEDILQEGMSLVEVHVREDHLLVLVLTLSVIVVGSLLDLG